MKAKKSGDDDIRHALLKEVAAFLNTEGGVILIGVSDDKKVTGIECDAFKDPESYVRRISQVIASALGDVAATLTLIEIHEYDGKRICAVKCNKSAMPIYSEFKKGSNKRSSDMEMLRASHHQGNGSSTVNITLVRTKRLSRLRTHNQQQIVATRQTAAR